MRRKIFAIGCVSILLIAMAAKVSETSVYQQTMAEDTESMAPVMTAEEKYETALNNGADLCFWYDDEAYEEFFKDAVVSYYDKEGIVVKLCYVDNIDYVGEIYDATMADAAFPDVYLLSGEELEKAYLYGVAKENDASEAYEGIVAENAVNASIYGNKMYGYPLSYNVCLLAYNSQYFTEQPTSLRAIIDYSDENEPDENVEYLLEWDVHDPFYDFLFVSESVVVDKTEAGVMEVSYNDAMLDASLTFLQESLESFSIPIDTVSERSVLNDVISGKTLCAIIDSDSIKDIQTSGYEVIEFPKLNDEIGARSVALTDMLVVNDFTTDKNEASAFAKFLSLEQSEKLWELSGHYPVKIQDNASIYEKTAYQAYENAILAPNSHDEGGFWVDLNEMITQYF